MSGIAGHGRAFPSWRRARAADGTRIRAANRNGAGPYETVTLADHQTGAPFAMLNIHDAGGEIAATPDLLSAVTLPAR